MTQEQQVEKKDRGCYFLLFQKNQWLFSAVCKMAVRLFFCLKMIETYLKYTLSENPSSLSLVLFGGIESELMSTIGEIVNSTKTTFFFKKSICQL